ncbi:hypothetical protein [Algibacter pectinivorans]|uniref:PL28 ulvan lyase domain-containing protein n=1 Tax=Algibacter pectinivorans TaxID=870482 RepID=A0A1I1QZM6_9FLAO|nr:hypothetical protein [Algibacter pectinivorans]SFD27495.1 hypothetical protein SAMN04487987_10824 [Algibacter pectinivorans]
MKKTKNNLIKVLLLALIFVYSSCSKNEELDSMTQDETISFKNLPVEEAPLENTDENNNYRLSGKRTSQACDNPNNYQIYTADEVGIGTDFVSKYTTSGVSVDRMRNLDDRTCAYNYSQETRGGINYGKYRLRAGTNPFDSRQPRIERTTVAVNNNNGAFVRFDGQVRIRRVGDANNNLSQTSFGENSGTYIIQAKGTHSGGGGSVDPAICLIVAKPGRSGYFNLYREEIKFRGGENSSGRKLVPLLEVPADRRINLTMINGFNANGTQYVNTWINGSFFGFPVPDSQTQKGLTAKIRFGAYRCKNGEADIWWNNVTHDFSNGTASNNNNNAWNPANSFAKLGTSFSSSEWSSQYATSYGLDGNNNTRWASASQGTTANHYLGNWPGTWRTIKRAKVTFDSAIANDFYILYYDGTGDWKVAKHITNNNSQTVKIEGMNAYGYGFIIYSLRQPYGHISIHELEFYDH